MKTYSNEIANKINRQMDKINDKLATLVNDKSGEFEKQQYRFKELDKLARKNNSLP